MIRQLTGIVADITDGSVVIDVGGVGYLVATPLSPAHFTFGSTVTLHTHLAVRETALDLYGFGSRDDLHLFSLLLGIPKVGPKSALQIMTQADVAMIKKAVLSDDASYLHKMAGIGKKTAEKIVIELKDKFDGFSSSDTAADGGDVVADTPFAADAIDALVALGYPQVDARKAVQQLPADITTANEAVRAALQQLGQA